jgi:hypothetical protein
LLVDTRFNNVTLDRFIAVYFSEDFNNAVAKVSGLKSRTLVDEKIQPDGSRERRVRMRPDVTLPGPIARLAPADKIAYDEVSSYDAKAQLVHYRIESAAEDRVKVAGTIKFIVEGADVRRVIDGVIEVKAPLGLGSLVEKFIEEQTQKGYAKIGAFLQKWLDEHP